MSESEWFACQEPDLMLEFLIGRIGRAQLVDFVTKCWDRISQYLPPVPREHTLVEQFADAVEQMSDMDAATYAAEAALKAARWAPDLRAEQKQQAKLLRQIVANPWQNE